jgi:tetratricopeptide (TPR) repeat protein
MSTQTHRRESALASSASRLRSRLVLASAFLAVVALAAWGAWWLSHRERSADIAVETATMEPQERALREKAQRAPRDGDAQRSLGLYLLARRRPYEAMWALQDALELRPEDAEAHRGLARALIVAQLPRRSLEVLAERPARSATTSAKQGVAAMDEIEDRRVAAAAYLSMGDPLGAVTMLEAVGTALNNSAPALLDLGNAYEAMGEDDAAKKAYQRLVQLQPDHVEGQLALARVAARRGGWDQVFAALSAAQKAAPDDPRPMYQFARALQARGGPRAGTDRSGSAIDYYRRVLRAHPDFGPAYLQLGLWFQRKGQPGPAILSLQRALDAHAGGDETRLRLASALDAAGRSADAAYQRGRFYEVTQEPLRAIQEYERMAVLDPGRRNVPLLISTVYAGMEKDEQGAEVARKAVEKHPNDLELRDRYATMLLLKDDRARAVELCRRWMKETPNWGEPYYLAARIERMALHPKEAARLGEQAMARDPRNAQYCLETAHALIATSNPDSLRRAAPILRQGIALDPTNAEMHLRLGELLERLGDPEGARFQYLRSMDLERSIRFGAYSLSQLCPRMKKPDRARFYAEIVRALRDREDATKVLWRQVNRAPGDAAAHARLADQLSEAGDSRQALYQLQQALHRHPDRRKEIRLQILRRLLSMREG